MTKITGIKGLITGAAGFKKGILISFVMALLAIVVLGLAILLFRANLSSKERLLELAAMDRAYELDASLQKSLRAIFQRKEISVNVTNGSVYFESPFPNNETSFGSLMGGFESFVEEKEAAAELNTSTITEEFSLVINPLNITYGHMNSSGDSIGFFPSQINFDGYYVLITTPENITACPEESLITEPFYLVAGAEGTGGLNCQVRNINPLGSHTIKTTSGYVTIEGSANGVLLVSSKDVISGTNLKMGVFFNNTQINQSHGDGIYVGYPPSVAKINFSDFGIYKDGPVRII